MSDKLVAAEHGAGSDKKKNFEWEAVELRLQVVISKLRDIEIQEVVLRR